MEFRHRIDALSAVANLTGTKLDGRVIRVELDAGFKPGRQYGRGASGGQVRDDRGGGSGRDRRQSGGGGGHYQPQQSSNVNKPRWEPPSQAASGGGGAAATEPSIYGPAGDVDAQVGEKRRRADETDNAQNKDPRYGNDDTM